MEFSDTVYPKIGNSTWPKTWSLARFLPSNICTAMNGVRGSGACEFNRYCSINEDRRPVCRCPKGYNFIDPNDALRGCKPTFLPHSCDQALPETDLFMLHDMPNTDWPMSDYESFTDVSEEWCSSACLADCFCAVMVFRNGSCWKKKVPLSNGMRDPSVTAKTAMKIRNDLSSPLNPSNLLHKKDHCTLVVFGSVLLGGSAFLNLIFFLVILTGIVRLYHKKTNSSSLTQTSNLIRGMGMRIFTSEELDRATDGFNEQLGRGASATVYKGVLTESVSDNNLVAVKKLDNVVSGKQEFKVEMSTIGLTNHKNLVKLIGFCNEDQNKLFVYEFMSHGSLANFLFGSTSKPNWYQRIQIALGTARGLCYLHEECSTQIIHCDIKPPNVLLDENFTAKISDFGLSKLLDEFIVMKKQ